MVFELSKVERPVIRERIVGHLLNIDKVLAKKVADGLRLKEMPLPAEAARPHEVTSRKSPALSIQMNGFKSFKGRKLGVLVTDEADSRILSALQQEAAMQGAVVEIIAPMIGGVKMSDGTWVKHITRS